MKNGWTAMTPETKGDFAQLKAGDSFEFSPSETGYVDESGKVHYNDQGLERSIFDNAEDAAAYLLDGECVHFLSSKYLGSRDADAEIENRLLKEGIGIDPEEDGSDVWSLPEPHHTNKDSL